MPSDNDDQSVSSDDDEPAVTKKQKTYEEADGPIEDDKSARAKLEEAGFDPDDVHTARSVQMISRQYWDNVTPMAYFASLGDLPMCRHLHHVRDATATAAAEEHMADQIDDEVVFSPLYAAIN